VEARPLAANAGCPFPGAGSGWVCEITSRSTAGFDRVKKLPVYLREGVAHAWLVDPMSRTTEALRRETDRWILIGNIPGDSPARIEPFEAHELDLRALWLDEEAT
jgi:Uma2 family endonuclease